jgi:hypothetical protein
MLRRSQVRKVRKLLAEGWSLRKIARTTRLARGTVDDIAYGPRYNPLPSPSDDGRECLGRPVRCTRCGGMVYPPCRLCRVRAIKARKALLAKLRGADASRIAGRPEDQSLGGGGASFRSGGASRGGGASPNGRGGPPR